MRPEYEAIVEAGIALQLDCPDLAMARHLLFAESELEEFRSETRSNVEALNEALRHLPAERLRVHVCRGNYEGPHHRDVAPGRRPGHRRTRQAERHLGRGQSIPVTATSGGVSENVACLTAST